MAAIAWTVGGIVVIGLAFLGWAAIRVADQFDGENDEE